jgi:hypothetical protein
MVPVSGKPNLPAAPERVFRASVDFPADAVDSFGGSVATNGGSVGLDGNAGDIPAASAGLPAHLLEPGGSGHVPPFPSVGTKTKSKMCQPLHAKFGLTINLDPPVKKCPAHTAKWTSP